MLLVRMRLTDMNVLKDFQNCFFFFRSIRFPLHFHPYPPLISATTTSEEMSVSAAQP